MHPQAAQHEGVPGSSRRSASRGIRSESAGHRAPEPRAQQGALQHRRSRARDPAGPRAVGEDPARRELTPICPARRARCPPSRTRDRADRLRARVREIGDRAADDPAADAARPAPRPELTTCAALCCALTAQAVATRVGNRAARQAYLLGCSRTPDWLWIAGLLHPDVLEKALALGRNAPHLRRVAVATGVMRPRDRIATEVLRHWNLPETCTPCTTSSSGPATCTAQHGALAERSRRWVELADLYLRRRAGVPVDTTRSRGWRRSRAVAAAARRRALRPSTTASPAHARARHRAAREQRASGVSRGRVMVKAPASAGPEPARARDAHAPRRVADTSLGGRRQWSRSRVRSSATRIVNHKPDGGGPGDRARRRLRRRDARPRGTVRAITSHRVFCLRHRSRARGGVSWHRAPRRLLAQAGARRHAARGRERHDDARSGRRHRCRGSRRARSSSSRWSCAAKSIGVVIATRTGTPVRRRPTCRSCACSPTSPASRWRRSSLGAARAFPAHAWTGARASASR